MSKNEKEETKKSPTATKTSKKHRHSNNNDFLERLPTFLKLRKITVAGAPKLPLTGYVRYMNDRREMIRKEHPDKNAMEHTKIIAEEWHLLPDDRKAPYIKLAESEKQRYVADLHEFLREHPDVIAKEIAKNKKRKKSKHKNSDALKNDNNFNMNADVTTIDPIHTNSLVDNVAKFTKSKQSKAHNNNCTFSPPNSSTAASISSGSSGSNGSNSCSSIGAGSFTNGNLLSIVQSPGEISIYTNEFLEHNKICDMEVRTLRKNKSDLEQQCAVLEKHVETVKTGIEKLAQENYELAERANCLDIYLNKIKRKLSTSFSSLALPAFTDGATTDNIEDYMKELQKMATANTHGPACLNKAKDIIRKLDWVKHLTVKLEIVGSNRMKRLMDVDGGFSLCLS